MNTVKKIKRLRKPMSAEQRIAATERLAKAREKRLRENPPQYKNIAKEVINLPDDHILCLKNIRKWIKTQKELLTVERKAVRDNMKGAISRAASIEGYIRNCEYYLKHGDWCDDFYGEYQEKRVRWKKVM